jgi:aminoglycoside 3-N-acetyltransferase
VEKIHTELKSFLINLGLKESSHIIIHSSFNRISSVFPQLKPIQTIDSLKEIITSSGSIVFPTFTYCFKKSSGDYEIFNRLNSKSKVGLLSETFRLSDGVIRTSSPTHSFGLWGKITNDIIATNSPESPLGEGSVLEWLTYNSNTYVLMLGTDFSSLTYVHYLEIQAKVPWYDFSPWDYLNVLPIGVSTNGEERLKEIPGCAKSFVNFEKYLVEKNLIKKYEYEGLNSYLICIKQIYAEGLKFFSEQYNKLLCPPNTCKACDSRRRKFL